MMKNISSRLIAEAAKTESYVTEDTDFATSVVDIRLRLADIPELKSPLVYTAEAVNLFGIGEGSSSFLCIESDSLLKYMDSARIPLKNIKEAVYNVLNANRLDVENLSEDVKIVIDSDKVIDKAIHEAKSVRSLTDKPIQRLRNIGALVDLIESAGLGVIKRKSE